MIFTVGLVMAQTDAYKGVGDIKVNLGANLQDGGTGIISSVDYGRVSQLVHKLDIFLA